MDTSLMMYDIEKFLEKYTRFMTKNIYISKSKFCQFFSQYCYLYQTLEKDKYLYCDNVNFKKMMNIKKNQMKLLKLHNQKYLMEKRKQYQSFFLELYPTELDIRKQNIILCDEDSMLVIQPKNMNPLLVGKVKYLSEIKKYSLNKILILTKTEHEGQELAGEFLKKGLDIVPKSLETYSLSFLKKEETLLSWDKQYEILIHYFIYQLFPSKKSFCSFYQAFSKYIYLNKDYKDYETFKDYHNYIYKRKFLSSNLSLKKFNEQEIKKRRSYLRTAQNEVMPTKEEVDIANFLYFNSISYHYDSSISVFLIKLDEKCDKIQYLKEESENISCHKKSLDSTIYLYSSYLDKANYLEKLAYELIKRRYPMERLEEEVIYDKLKETTIENYFASFIQNYFIPAINYYEKNGNLDDTNFTNDQRVEFLKVYSKYQEYFYKHHFVREQDLFQRIRKKIESNSYQYLILVGDISLDCHVPYLKVISEYDEMKLLKENIILLYDYKKYLCHNQTLPIAHTYLNIEELNGLTVSFLKENLSIVNKTLEENKKDIEIYFYEDSNRLHIYQNIANVCAKILEQEKKNTLIGVEHLKDINLLIGTGYFSKLSKSILLTKTKIKISCDEIFKVRKIQENILLPFMILDSFHEDLLKKDNYYQIKVMLYVALNKCRGKLIILCPLSREREISKLFSSLRVRKIKEIVE